MANIERYNGTLTLWASFADLHDERPDDDYVAMVSEDNYVHLHDQLRGAVEENERLQKVNDGLRASLRKMRADGEEAIRRARQSGGQ